jgi:acetyltransferase-like isoleucine patch superfamily enzyme
MKIEKNVSIAFGVMFDFFYPELIELKENCIIGYNVTILTHEFLQNELRKGKVIVGRNALIGANSTLLPGIIIGDNAIVSAMSLVNSNVKENSFVGGIPAKEISDFNAK